MKKKFTSTTLSHTKHHTQFSNFDWNNNEIERNEQIRKKKIKIIRKEVNFVVWYLMRRKKKSKWNNKEQLRLTWIQFFFLLAFALELFHCIVTHSVNRTTDFRSVLFASVFRAPSSECKMCECVDVKYVLDVCCCVATRIVISFYCIRFSTSFFFYSDVCVFAQYSFDCTFTAYSHCCYWLLLLVFSWSYYCCCSFVYYFKFYVKKKNKKICWCLQLE